MTNSEKKGNLYEKISKGGSDYLALTNPNSKSCTDLGYVTSKSQLLSEISKYASINNTTVVDVISGSNIMSCGEGTTVRFNVSLTIS